MKAVLCPVCNGEGQVKDGEIVGTEITKINTKLCHGCGGKGWVKVNDNKESFVWPSNITWQDIYQCPSCGGNRNSPAGAGCLMGSHSVLFFSIQ